MTLTIATTGGDVLVHFSGSFSLNSSDSFDVAIFADGSEVTGSRRHVEQVSAIIALITLGTIPGFPVSTTALVTSVSSASHTYDARWSTTAGTARAITTQRNLSALEIPR